MYGYIDVYGARRVYLGISGGTRVFFGRVKKA